MKKSLRSRWAVISRDIVLSCRDARWSLGLGALLFIAAAMAYQTSLGPAADMQSIPALSDHVVFAFAGNHPLLHGSGVPFTLPVTGLY